MKKLLYLFLFLSVGFLVANYAFCDESSDWSKAIDVYDSGGLDRPVSAIEYNKVMKELDELKEKKMKKNEPFWKKQKEIPLQNRLPENDKVTVERNDIIKITTPLYYDGKTLPVGFYKVNCSEENNSYYINFMQGKTSLMKVKAEKVSFMDFCPEQVNCLESEVYQDKYFKVNIKTIDYALQGFLTIVKE